MILVYQGDDVQKITDLEFGSSSAFLLSFSYSSHIPHYLVSVSSLCVLQLVCARLFVASNRCIAFFFLFLSSLNREAQWKKFPTSYKVITVMNCNFTAFLSMQLWGGGKKVLLLVLSLQKSASRAGADFMNDAFWMKHFLKARAKCGASDNAITGAVIFSQQLPCCM